MSRVHCMLLHCLILALLAPEMPAAAPSLDLTEASAVVLLHDEQVTVGNNGLKKTRTLRRLKILESDAVDYIGDIEIPYNAHYERATLLRAHTITPDGHIVPVQSNLVVDMLPQSQGGFREYSDNRYLSFSMPALSQGAIIEYETEVIQTKPAISNAFWASCFLQELTPVQSAKYTVTIPREMPFIFKSSPAVHLASASTNNTTVTRTWTVTNMPALHLELGMPNIHEVLASVDVTSLTNWNTVIDWYQGLLKERSKCDSAMAAKAASIVANAKTPMEKVIALVNFVQSSVRYVAIELGEGAYQPRPAPQCFANLYGDCKDQAVLLVAMLRSVGISSEVALVSTTRGSQFEKALPSPGQFDHVIVWVPELNLWLDPTVQHLGAFTHPQMLDDTPALVVCDAAGSSGFRTIPCAPAALDTTETLLDIETMPDGMHHVRKTIRGTGRAAARLRSNFARMTPDERQKTMTQYAEKEPGFRRLREWKLDNIDATTNTFSIILDVDAEGFLAPSISGFTMVFDASDLSDDLFLSEPTDKKQGRRNAWVRNSYARNALECNITLPPGYRVGGQLDNAVWNMTNGVIRFSSTNNANLIRSRIEIDATPSRIAPSDYNRIRRDIDRQISRSKRSMEMIDCIQELISQFKPGAARALLKDLIAKYPNDAFLLARNADLLNACGYLHGARQAYKNALAKDPTRLAFYVAYAKLYSGTVGLPDKNYNKAAVIERLTSGKGKVIDAAGLQTELIKAYASDSSGQTPSKSGDLTKAIETAKAATDMYPDDHRLWLWYGDCLLQTNDFKTAHEAFSRAIELIPESLGGYIGQWRASALEGDIEAFVRAVQTMYNDLAEQTTEMIYVAQLLVANRRLDDAISIANTIAESAGNSPAARSLVQEFEDITEESMRDYRIFKDTSTPKQTALTFMSAFMFSDDAKFSNILSRLVSLPQKSFLENANNPILRSMTAEAKNLGLASLMVPRNVEEVPISSDLTLVKMKRASIAKNSLAVLCRKENNEWRIIDVLLPGISSTTLGLALESTIRSNDTKLRDELVSYYTQHANAEIGSMSLPNTGCPFLTHPFATPANQAKAIAAYCLFQLPGSDNGKRGLKYYEELSKAEPSNRAVWQELASGFARFRELSSAVTAMTKATALDPENPRLEMRRIHLLLLCGRIAEAETAITAVEAKLGSQPNVRDIRIRLLLQAGRLTEALTIADNKAHRGANSIPGRVEQDLFIAMGLHDRIEKIEKQLAFEPFNPMAHFNLFLTYSALDKAEKAREELEILILRDRTDVFALKDLYKCMILEGNMQEADCLWNQITTILPDEEDRGESLTSILIGRDQYKEAAEVFLAQKRTFSEDYFSHLQAACCYMLANDKVKSKEHLLMAAKSNSPDHNANRYAKMLLHELSPETLLAELQTYPDYMRRKDFLCEFYYYRGVLAQCEGDTKTAKEMYKASRDTQACQNIEHFLSKLALKKLTDKSS